MHVFTSFNVSQKGKKEKIRNLDGTIKKEDWWCELARKWQEKRRDLHRSNRGSGSGVCGKGWECRSGTGLFNVIHRRARRKMSWGHQFFIREF